VSVHTRPKARRSMEPGGRPPAPGSLHLVQRFLNTTDGLTGRDLIRTPDDLGRWLSRLGLPAAGLRGSARQVASLRRFREALRHAVAARSGGTCDAGAEAILARAAGRARVSLRWIGDGAVVVPEGTGADLVMNAVLCALAATDPGSRRRLNVCAACGWAFYDRSRNRSGVWCTMSVCGARAKMRRFRQARG